MSEDLPTTIPAAVRRAVARFGDREAMVDGDERFDFVELGRRVDEAGRALITSGIGAGDRVAIWAPNVWEWAIAALGVHTCGGVVIPLNTRFKGPEAADIVERSGARMLFTVTDFLDTDYAALLAGTGTAVGEVVVLRGTVPDGATSFAEFLSRAPETPAEDLDRRTAAIAPDDLCDILFTSGTTGRPKGAMLMHGPSLRAYDSWASVVGLEAGDRYLIVNPFFHAFGLKAGILASLLKGATMIPHAVFDVPSVMRRVSEERVTMLPGAPAIFQTMLNDPDLDRYDLSTLRLSVTGAATIPVEMILGMRDRLGFDTVVTGYGLTESHGIATMCRHDDDPATIATTSGRAIDGVEVRLVDEDGSTVGPREPGEVLVRGYNLMKGYLDDPEATAEAIDADGWLHTGDIAEQDESGNIWITDRKKDMFICGGFNAYPAEIEKQMMAHPDVASVAVIGVPDPRLGEVGMAFVVPRTGTAPEPDEMMAWAREHMANYKAPRHVELVDALPLNASNKVVKFELAERAARILA